MSTAKKKVAHQKDTAELVMFMEQRGFQHYIDLFLRHGFTYGNLHKLEERDLTQMRITNKKEREGVLAAIDYVKQEAKLPADVRRARKKAKVLDRSGVSERSRVSNSTTMNASEVSAATTGDQNGLTHMADGTVTTSSEDGSGMPNKGFDAFTANAMTANECAREASLFLNHHNIGRAWPQPGSKIAQSLNLTNSRPQSRDPIYSINLGDEKQAVQPPCHHATGYQAKFCKICQEFVQEGMQGQWQYQQVETITIGDGLTEEVTCWKPFEQAESLKIEYAAKRKQPNTKIRHKLVDFDKMKWGKKPLRRVNRDTVPFPTLKQRDIITAPTMAELPNAQLEAEIFDLTLLLVSDTEEKKSRIKIQQEEQQFRLDVAAQIQAIMLEYFATQRADVEAEETAARALIEGPEYERALDMLSEFEEQSVRDVAVKKMANEAAEIWAKQYVLLDELESKCRDHIEREEEASRENLEKLVTMLNAQCIEMLNRAKQKIQVQNDGKLRCAVCRKLNCTFHKQPWKNHWRHRGGSLDLKQTAEGFDTLSQLMGRAGELEYTECVANQKAQDKEVKAKRRLREYLTHRPPIGDDSFLSGSPQKLRDVPNGAEEPNDSSSAPNKVQFKKKKKILDGAVDPSIHLGASPIPRVVDESGDCDAEHLPPRPQSAAATSAGGHTTADTADTDLPSYMRPKSANAANRPASAGSRRSPSPSSFSQQPVFRNAVGHGYSVSNDSINRLTKRGVGRSMTPSGGSGKTPMRRFF